MITTDAIYNTLIASGSYEESVTGTLKDGSGATVLNISNEYIKTGSLIIDNKCINNDDLEPGAVYAAELKITITGNAGLTSSQKSSLQNGSLNLTYTITDGSSSSSISIGIYYIIEVTLKDEDVEIIAEDMMSRLSKNIPTAVREDLNFVARTPYELLDLCCQNCSTSKRPISLANDETEFDTWSNADASFLIPVTADIATYRDLVAEVAKIMGCFATIDKATNGLILKRLNPHSNSNVWTLNEDIRYSTEKSGYVCLFGKVSLGSVSYPTTSDDDVSGLILSMRASELTDDSEVLPGIVQNLYTELSGISYRPCKIDFMGNIALEVGDWIGVNYTEDGTTYTFRTIITHLNWILNGKELIESTGSSAATTKKVGSKGSGESRDSSSIDNLTNRIETLESAQGGGNKVYTSKSAPDNTLGNDGDLWVKYFVDYNDKLINSHGDEVKINLPRYENADDAYSYIDLTIRPQIRSICNLSTTAINAFVKAFQGQISIAVCQHDGYFITASQFAQLTVDTYMINNQSFNVSDSTNYIGWNSDSSVYYRYIGVLDEHYPPITNLDDFNDNLFDDGRTITVVYYYLYYNTSNKKIENINGSLSCNNVSHRYWEDVLREVTSDITIDLIDTAFLTIDKIYCKIDDDWVGYDGDGGSVVVVNQILQSGTEIAQISVDGEVVSIYAPTPQSVSVTQTQTEGTEIASINVGDTSTKLYAPTTTVTQVQTSGTEIAQINGTSLYAPTVSATQTLASGTEIATINVGDTSTKIYAPTGGGSDVTVTPITTTGTNIANIAVNGTTYNLFAPTSGGGEAIETAFVYSNEERVIGVWTDNRPLYQKNIYIGTLTYDTSWHQLPHNISDLGEVVKVYGRFKYLGDGMWYEFPNTRPNQTTSVCVGCNTTNIQYMNNWLPDTGYVSITLQYTKTTDTPGSGPYVTSGAYAHHYSANEQVVGTWIDGSTLYEKTQYGGITFSAQGTWYDTDITNIDKVVSVQGSINRDSEPINLGYWNSSTVSTWILRDHTLKLAMQVMVSSETYTLNSITVRYTKTS